MSRADRLRAESLEERQAAIAELAAAGAADAPELAALVDCLAHPRKAVQRPAADAFGTLAARGVEVRAVLGEALDAPDFRRRWGAAFALSRLGDPPPNALPVFLEALGADDGDVRWAAADVLVRLGDRAPLIARLREGVEAGNPPQRKMALYCLRDLAARTPDVEAVVLRALGDPERDVRLAAVATVARLAIDRRAAAERLLAVLATDDERVRRAAAAALGVLGERSPRVLAALEAASAAGDVSLRRAAEGALRLLGDAPA